MQPNQQSSTNTTDDEFATVLVVARTRRSARSAVRSVVEDLREIRATHAVILEARRRSAEKHARIVEASQRLINASRELLRRLGQEDGPAQGPLDQSQGSTQG
jgi:hypothetical protein